MNWTEIEGWFDEANHQAFLDHLNIPTNAFIVECGTYKGRSTTLMAQLWPKSFIVTFDPNENRPESLPSQAAFFKVRGVDFDTRLLPREIDLLFLDDDHQYDTVKANFEHFLPHVRSGGYVVFHDYIFPTAEGVKRFVDELGNCVLNQEGEYGLAIWRKP